MAQGYRTRFAPSPTGPLHLGHARTSLVAWLRARALGGAVVMRLEDLDLPRVRPGAAEGIYRDMRWLGLDWDEGPDVGGPHEPYVQSRRDPLYEQALERLSNSGKTFPCTCTRREVREASSAPHGAEGPHYPGTCRRGPTHPERIPSIRFRMDHPPRAFDDVLHGQVKPMDVADDFIVKRADDLFAYQLAVVVDDAAMDITEVVRGDDLLGSTPRQIALYEALGLAVPAFLHVPLVLGADGERLAKRHGAVSIADYREAGWTPERLVGWLAMSLGLQSSARERVASELVATFDPSAIPKSPVRLGAPP